MKMSCVGQYVAAGSSVVGQRRAFMTPPVSNSMRLLFSDNFRGRGMKRRTQVMSESNQSRLTLFHQGLATPTGAQQNALKRLPDVDDPRPPVVAWAFGKTDPDGSLKYIPVPNLATRGRKVLQGLYKDFREVYNQHRKFIPLYGGGPWDPEYKRQDDVWVHDSAAVSGAMHMMNHVYIGPGCSVRADLNEIFISSMVVLNEGVTINTDGHPLNVNLPGRISRINEGRTHIGPYTIIHSGSVLDSAHLGGFNEVGENCKIGYNAVMEPGSSLEPGSVLLAHQRVPGWEVWGGNPARRVGYRNKTLWLWQCYVNYTVHFRVKGLMEEQFWNARSGVATTRSSERLQYHMDRMVEKNKAKLPEKVKSYIAGETRDIPLWEEYKNTSRVNIRPGSRKATEFTYEPNKARWLDKY